MSGRDFRFLILVLAATLAVYLPNLGKSYISLDLPAYDHILHANKVLDTAVKLFSDFHGKVVTGYYAPLGSVTLMLDRFIVGSQVPFPQLTCFVNLMFHLANGVLLWFLLRRIGATGPMATIATYIFLLHPMQVPCIQWFAERKTVLGFFFYLGSYLLFLRFRRAGGPFDYLMSILWFTLGLLSKPPVVVLPLVLLLGEALGVHHVGSSSGPLVHAGYPGNSGIATGTGLFPESTYPIPAFITKARGALAVLAPFFLLSLLFIMISMATEGGSIVDLPMVRRPFIAAAAICYYVSKAVVPIDIVPIHAKWNVGPTGLVWWAFLLAVAASGYIIIRFRTRVSREFLWGSGSFLFPLLPAIGIVGFGWLQLSYVGDHLAYFSIAGMGCCFAWVGMRGLESSRRGVRNATVAVIAVYAVVLPVLSFIQARTWANPVSLWSRNVDLYTSNVTAHYMLGVALDAEGHLKSAKDQFEQVIRADPRSIDAYTSIASILLKENNAPQAEIMARKAIEISPAKGSAFNYLGESLFRQAKQEQALQAFRESIRLNPTSPAPYNNMGNLFLSRGNPTEAERLFRQAASIQAGAYEARNNLGVALMQLNRFEEARACFARAVAIKPVFPKGYANLGFASAALGKNTEAVASFKRAIELDPKFGLLRIDIAKIHESTGNVDDAAREYAEAADHFPDAVEPRVHLARLMVRVGRPDLAVGPYERVLQTAPDDYITHNELGKVLLGLGRREQARFHFRRALEIRSDFTEAQSNLKAAKE